MSDLAPTQLRRDVFRLRDDRGGGVERPDVAPPGSELARLTEQRAAIAARVRRILVGVEQGAGAEVSRLAAEADELQRQIFAAWRSEIDRQFKATAA